jgi:hypothetical protein
MTMRCAIKRKSSPACNILSQHRAFFIGRAHAFDECADRVVRASPARSYTIAFAECSPRQL